MLDEIGKLLIYLGLIFLTFGFLLIIFSKISTSGIPLGRLPGDIYIKKDNFVFYFPITTSILISVVLTIIFYLLSFISKGK